MKSRSKQNECSMRMDNQLRIVFVCRNGPWERCTYAELNSDGKCRYYSDGTKNRCVCTAARREEALRAVADIIGCANEGEKT